MMSSLMLSLKLVLVVTLLVRTGGCSLQRILHRINEAGSSSNDSRELAHCAKRATAIFFTPSNNIVVIVDDNESTTANDYLKIASNNGISVTVVNTMTSYGNSSAREILNTSSWRYTKRETSYVIMSSNVDNLCKIFGHVEILSIWSEYLIITRMNEYQLRAFAFSLTKRNYLRFAFVEMKDDNSIVLRRYTNLSRRSSKLDRNSELKTLSNCVITRNDDNTLMANFPNESEIEPLSSDVCPISGCDLIVGYVKDDVAGTPSDSFEIRRRFDVADHMIKFFRKVYDIRLRARNVYSNVLNWTQAFEFIEQDKIDIAYYGSFVPNDTHMGRVEVANWYDFEAIMFVDVSQFAISAPLSNVFLPLDYHVWLCIIVLLTIYSAFAIAVKAAYRRKIISKPIRIFDIWAILLGQGVDPPINTGLRAVLGMWMMAVLLINMAYGSGFSSSLTSFVHIDPLKTFQDLSQSQRSIFGTAPVRELFNNWDNPIAADIYAKWRVVKPNDILPIVTTDLVVGADYYSNVKQYNLMKSHNKSRLYVLEEPVLVYPLNFYLKKHHPYVKPLRQLIDRTRDTGIIEKWCIDNTYKDKSRASNLAHRRPNPHKYGGRSLCDFKVAFKIWGVGMFISLVMFFWECYAGRKSCSFLKKTKTKGI